MPLFEKITSVQFSSPSPDEVLRLSVAEIRTNEYFNEDGSARCNGLYDPRMGTLDRTKRCVTCNGTFVDCPGHFGHIKLAAPVYHAAYVRKITKILSCFCFSCSRLLASDQDLCNIGNIKTTKRLNYVYKLCLKRKFCDISTNHSNADANSSGGCGKPQPSYKRTDIWEFSAIWKTAEIARSALSSNDDEVSPLLRATISRSGKVPLAVEQVLKLLTRINDEDSSKIGFPPQHSRPESVILTILAVPPPVIRPSTAGRHDDLTSHYAKIVKLNNELDQLIRVDDYPSFLVKWRQLQTQIFYLFGFEAGSQSSLVGATKTMESLKDRLKGKQGRIRGNLMGKRVDFSARTVVTADPNLRIDEVGVPKSIARTLTYPELVTPYNIVKLQTLVDAKYDQYPNANYVIDDNGQRWDLTFRKLKIKEHNHDQKIIGDSRQASGKPSFTPIILQPGYTVERQLQNGDAVVFNRQPTLHKMSMMGHRVRVLPWSTFRMNLSCTTPYNADFDGDEMNLHVPQTIEARAEVEHLLLVSRQLVTPQFSKPVMGIVQDALTAAYKITRRDVFLTWPEVQNLLMHLPNDNFPKYIPKPCICKPKPMWSGKQIFSLVVPASINLLNNRTDHDEESMDHWCSLKDSTVIISNRELLAGTLCKRTLGTSSGSLLHVCFLDLGYEKCANFYNNIQTIVTHWLQTNGHSVGITDIMVSAQHARSIQQAIDDAKLRAQQVPHNQPPTKLESAVTHILNQARETSDKIVRNGITSTNNLRTMVSAGSKGSDINISQIIGCLGQQNVHSKRIPNGYRHRTLPHFTKFDESAEARGFVQNSYYTGLTPSEFFFHAMGGREGLIDTAVKTAESGYIQRRLMKSMESLMVYYDATVRNSYGEVLQLYYGEDGFAGEFLENVSVDPPIAPPVRCTVNDLVHSSKYTPILKSFLLQQKELIDEILKREFDCISECHRVVVSLQKSAMCGKPRQYIAHTRSKIYEKHDFYHPPSPHRVREKMKKSKRILCQQADKLNDIVSTARLQLHNRQSRAKNNSNIGQFVHTTSKKPIHHLSEVKLPCNIDRIIQNVKTDLNERSEQTDLTPFDVFDKVEELLNKRCRLSHHQESSVFFQTYLRVKLSTSNVILRHCMTRKSFDTVCQVIEHKFHSALAQPGEMVGPLAAQSIGEPATQMTLNTFHHAGVSSQNVTLGIPRLQEILNATSNPESPSLTVYLKSGHQIEDQIEKIRWQLQYTTVKHLILGTSIYYDPDTKTTTIEEDRDILELYNCFSEPVNHSLSAWVLRLEFDKRKLTASNITLEGICEKILHQYEGTLQCIHSDENATNAIVHVRVNETKFSQNLSHSGFKLLKNVEEKMILPLHLQGIPQIDKVHVYKPLANSEWCFKTTGSNLRDALSNPNVDYHRTVSNHLHQVRDVLGIEAARTTIEREIYNLFRLYGLHINHRHLSLLCDTMTAKGSLMAITRHGINRQHTGPLERSSFEEAADVLNEAAIHGECDRIRGVSEHLIVARVPRIGTGAFDLLFDTAKYSPDNQNTLNHHRSDTDIETTSYKKSDNEALNDDVDPPSYKLLSPKHCVSSNFDLSESVSSSISYSCSSSPQYEHVTYTPHSPTYSP